MAESPKTLGELATYLRALEERHQSEGDRRPTKPTAAICYARSETLGAAHRMLTDLIRGLEDRLLGLPDREEFLYGELNAEDVREAIRREVAKPTR